MCELTNRYSSVADGGTRLWGWLSIDNLIAILIPLLVVGLSYWLTSRGKQIQIYKSLLGIKSLLNQLVRQLSEPVAAQAKSMNDLVEQINAPIPGDFTITINTNINLQAIFELPKVGLFRALVLNAVDIDGVEDQYRILWNSLYKTKRVIERIELDFTELAERNNTYTRWFNEGASALEDAINQFVNAVAQQGYKKGSDSYFDEFDRITSSWQQMDKAGNIIVMTENLIEPLRELCRSHQGDPRNNIFLPILLRCLHAYQNYQKMRDIYLHAFRDHADSLEETSRHFISTAQYFSEADLKKPTYYNAYRMT